MLFEKYRPKDWPDLVGQDKARDMARRIIDRPGFDRGAFYIHCAGANNSGVGKTSLAKLIAGQLADPFFTIELDGARLDKTAVQDMERAAWLSTWGSKRFRVYIVNECHAMTQGAVDALLTFLESMPRHFVIIFTTTREPAPDLFGDDAGAFSSRCHVLTLTNQGLSRAFAERARTIAQAEGLDGQPVEAYIKLAQVCKNNLRAMLQRIEAGAMVPA